VPDCVLEENGFSDPQGDDFGLVRGSFDIVSVRAGADSQNLCLRVEFADDLAGGAQPFGDIFGFIAIDTDSDPATGIESTTDFLCDSPSGMGQDAEVLVLGGGMIAPVLSGLEPFSTSSLPPPPNDYGVMVFAGNAVSVTIPLDLIGGDEAMDVAMVLGSTLEPTDCAPNEGHLSLPIAARLHGDIDCDGDVDAVDAQKLLADVGGLPTNLPPGCPDPGSPAGDIDCDGDVDAVDVLNILRHLAGLAVEQVPGCTDVGEPFA
jgi:hypothetical protein